MQKFWQVHERLDKDVWSHILALRGLTDTAEQQAFFSPALAQLIPPTDWPNMAEAVSRIWQAIERGEKVVVWGDFDADGVTSTAILWETLFDLGANVMPYVPNRDAEGHGFSQEGMQRLVDDRVSLVITVDHGITAFEEIAHLQSMGVEVIVTDHHEPSRHMVDGSKNPRTQESSHDRYALPECVAVIHPFLLAEPQKLAGCGTAYALAYAVWLGQPLDEAARRQDSQAARKEFAQGKIGLAALGTIADLMPLIGDNRVLAAEGLKVLAKTDRIGLQALYRSAGLTPGEKLSVYDVGFVVAPRLNAPGRLGDALESLRLLCTKDPGRAGALAGMLNDLNIERQELLKRVTMEAGKAIEQRGALGAYVVQDEGWPAGVCGLAAGKLVERVYRPVVVMEQQGEMARGSARSIRGFDITAALGEISHLLDGFGGHAMAAGFRCKSADVPEIERLLSDMVLEKLTKEELQPKLLIDAEVEFGELDQGLVDNLKLLEPCGMGNPQSVFVSRNVRVVESRAIGKDKKHLKLKLQSATSQKSGTADVSSISESIAPPHVVFDAVAFNFGHMVDLLGADSHIDVSFTLEENVWNGRTSLQLKVKDLKKAT